VTRREALRLAVGDRVEVARRGRSADGTSGVDWVPGHVRRVVHVPALEVFVDLERQPWRGRRVPSFRAKCSDPADLRRAP